MGYEEICQPDQEGMAFRPRQDRRIRGVEVGSKRAGHKNHLGYGDQEGAHACDRKEARACDQVRIVLMIHKLITLKNPCLSNSWNRKAFARSSLRVSMDQ